jgi:hypothetical protein
MPTFEYPLAAPTLSGTVISVDMMLQEPTRVTRYISDLMLKNYFANRIFTNAGGVSGGAVLYDQLTTNDLFPTRDVQNVEPGAEFPIVTFDRQQPLLAQVEKFGGKFFITDEARDRNNPQMLQQGSVKLANAIYRGIHQRALAVLDAQITALGGSAQTLVGHNWSTVVTAGTSATSASGYPAADFAAVQLLADTKELGVHFSLWIVNPAQLAAIKVLYGATWADVLNSWNVSMIASNLVTAGTAYVVAEGQVGEQRLEKPLGSESWREQSTQRSWVQTDVRPVFYVTNPYSVAKVTGLAG